jgi:hypothetical protein
VRRTKSSYGFYGNATGYGYTEQTQYNRLDGGAGLGAAWQVSTATEVSLGAAAGYGHTDSSYILGQQGLLLPLSRTIDYNGSLGLRHRFSPKTALGASVRGYYVDFPDSELEPGSSLRLGLDLARHLGTRDSLHFEYALERASFHGANDAATAATEYWTHYGTAGWQRTLSARSALKADAGLSYTANSGDSTLGQAWNFFGGVGFSREIKRSSLSATYRREVMPAFGLGGLQMTDRFGLDLSTPVGRNGGVAFGSSYSRGSGGSAGDGEDPPQYADVFGAIGRRLKQRLLLSLDGRYLYQSVPGQPAIDTFRIGLFLTFGPSAGQRGPAVVGAPVSAREH